MGEYTGEMSKYMVSGGPPLPPPTIPLAGKTLGSGGRRKLCMMPCHSCLFMGFEGATRGGKEGFRVIIWGWSKPQRGGGGVLNIYGGELFSLAPCITNIYQHLMKSSLIALNIVLRMNSVSLCSILFGMYYLIVLRILFEMNLPMNPRDLNHLVNSLSEISWA